MAELIQCPNCLQWLNLETREAVSAGESADGELLYRCTKCNTLFTEYGLVVWWINAAQ